MQEWFWEIVNCRVHKVQNWGIVTGWILKTETLIKNKISLVSIIDCVLNSPSEYSSSHFSTRIILFYVVDIICHQYYLLTIFPCSLPTVRTSVTRKICNNLKMKIMLKIVFWMFFFLSSFLSINVKPDLHVSLHFACPPYIDKYIVIVFDFVNHEYGIRI